MGYGYNPIVGENWRYNPEKTFKISRSKIELFFNCATCFYKDVKLGLRKPPMPGWAINSAVDDLLIKEMDFCRTQDRPHGIFKENLSLDHFEISIDDMTLVSNIAIDEQKCLAWSGDFDPLEVD